MWLQSRKTHGKMEKKINAVKETGVNGNRRSSETSWNQGFVTQHSGELRGIQTFSGFHHRCSSAAKDGASAEKKGVKVNFWIVIWGLYRFWTLWNKLSEVIWVFFGFLLKISLLLRRFRECYRTMMNFCNGKTVSYSQKVRRNVFLTVRRRCSGQRALDDVIATRLNCSWLWLRTRFQLKKVPNSSASTNLHPEIHQVVPLTVTCWNCPGAFRGCWAFQNFRNELWFPTGSGCLGQEWSEQKTETGIEGLTHSWWGSARDDQHTETGQSELSNAEESSRQEVTSRGVDAGATGHRGMEGWWWWRPRQRQTDFVHLSPTSCRCLPADREQDTAWVPPAGCTAHYSQRKLLHSQVSIRKQYDKYL